MYCSTHWRSLKHDALLFSVLLLLPCMTGGSRIYILRSGPSQCFRIIYGLSIQSVLGQRGVCENMGNKIVYIWERTRSEVYDSTKAGKILPNPHWAPQETSKPLVEITGWA